jgi:hypothetical protein
MSLIIPFSAIFTLLLISYRNQCICFQNGFIEANTIADDYTRTHTLIYLKNKRAGGVPNLNYLLIIILINQNQVLWRKNKNSYSPLEINKGELPKSFSYCIKRGTMFRMFFHKDNVRIYNTIK